MDKSSRIIILACAILLVHLSSYAQAKVKLVNVVFRHGDRAPDNNGLEMYPNDPNIKNEFEPMRLGGLTNDGKYREFHLGEYLRSQYGDIISDKYYPEQLSARSTNVDRTKMSLQLVLAGLYPPKNNQRWNENLNWQPIPAHYVPKLDDNLMIPEECPKYLEARARVEVSNDVLKTKKSFENLLAKLTEKTGKTIANSNDMYFLYHALMAEYSMNLTIPDWAQDIFPYGELLRGINFEYEIFSYNDEMKKLNGGMLLRRIIENMEISINGTIDPERKIHLYSGHETNVAALLQALGVYTPHVPEYTSGVIVELHENNTVIVKYYKGKGFQRTNDGREDVVLTIPGCDSQACPIDIFKSVLSKVTPSDDDIVCDKRSLRGKFLRNQLNVPSGIGYQILDELEKEDKVKNTLH